MRARWAFVAVLAVAACGHPSSSVDPDAAIDGDGSATDGGVAWMPLIERSWSTIAHSEQYRCRREVVTEDMYVTGFRALSPTGTHHEMVTIPMDQTAPAGDFDCDPSYITSGATLQLLYAGGFGTNDFLFPSGVAIKIPAGTVIQLYLHVANFSDQPLTEASGILVQTIPASQVAHEAEMRFFGKAMFSIPATGQPYSITTSCGSTGDWHIVGMWPHMHTLATHQKIEVQHLGVTMKTPLDADYNFMEQKSYPMDFVVAANDYLQVTCTWVNNTGGPVGSGDSAAAEMCYAGAFMYPKIGYPYACVQ
jgi:hypothetical protein